MKRRTYLASTAGILGAISGCNKTPISTKEKNEEEKTTLEAITVSNHHPESHTIDILVETANRVVYWNSFEVEAFDRSENVAHGPAIEPPAFPEKSAYWSVSARLRSRTTGKRIAVNETTPSGGCILITVQINKKGNLLFLHDTPDC